MTMMAMAHPRRYFSLSAVGAIAIRLPPTSSRMYTSSVSDPLVNTSKTSSAASSVASGRWFIICSTAVQERRVMRSPSTAGPRVSRTGSDRPGVGPHPTLSRRRGARVGRAGGTGALAAVSAGEPQELHVHLDTPPELTERGADPRGVRREPALELAGVQRGSEAERQDAVRLHRRGDDLVVERERARVRLRNPLELAR